MDRSHGFGSHKDKLFLLSLRFSPSCPSPLPPPLLTQEVGGRRVVSNSLALITCKPIIQKVRLFLACFALHGFWFFFTLALLFFSTFPHGTLFSIGVWSYLALDVLFTLFQASFWCSTLFFSPPPHTRLFYSLWLSASHLLLQVFGFFGFKVQISSHLHFRYPKGYPSLNAQRAFRGASYGFWLHLFRSPLL